MEPAPHVVDHQRRPVPRPRQQHAAGPGLHAGRRHRPHRARRGARRHHRGRHRPPAASPSSAVPVPNAQPLVAGRPVPLQPAGLAAQRRRRDGRPDHALLRHARDRHRPWSTACCGRRSTASSCSRSARSTRASGPTGSTPRRPTRRSPFDLQKHKDLGLQHGPQAHQGRAAALVLPRRPARAAGVAGHAVACRRRARHRGAARAVRDRGRARSSTSTAARRRSSRTCRSTRAGASGTSPTRSGSPERQEPGPDPAGQRAQRLQLLQRPRATPATATSSTGTRTSARTPPRRPAPASRSSASTAGSACARRATSTARTAVLRLRDAPERPSLTDRYRGPDQRRRSTSCYGAGSARSVYTQITDVEGEVNGFWTYDRQVLKLDRRRVRATPTSRSSRRRSGSTPPARRPGATITGPGGKCVDVAADDTGDQRRRGAAVGLPAQRRRPALVARRRRRAPHPRPLPGRRPATAPPTAPRSSCGTATAAAPSSGCRRPTARCATRSPAAAWTPRAAPPPTAPGCRSGTATAPPRRTSGQRRLPGATFVNGPGGQCVDVAADDTGGNGTAVQLWGCQPLRGRPALGDDGNGRCARWAGAWTSTGDGTANGTQVELWDCNGGGGQQWVQQADGSLRNPQSGRCLDSPERHHRQRHPAADLGLQRQRGAGVPEAVTA